MKASRGQRRWLGLAVVAALVAGCSEDPGTPDRPPPTRQAAPASPAAENPAGSRAGSPAAVAPVEERVVDAAGDRLVLGVEPLVRQGEAVVLTVRVRLAEEARRAVVVSRHFSGGNVNVFDGGRLVDTGARRVYPVAESAGGSCVCTGSLRLGPGETQPLQAVFAGVPATVERLSVMLPYAGVFADVPVGAGPVPGPASGGDLLGREHKALDAASAVARSAALDAYTDRLDVGLRTKRTPDRVELDLSSDVLFRVDSAELTGEARRTVDAAVTDVRAAGAGPLTITGHTDDVGTDAHNQRLSQRRAEAVAGALRGALPDDRYPKRVAAKGESAPAVPNDSDEHRARNRRVTIGFQASKPATPAPAAPAKLPATKGRTGTAAEGVEVRLPLNRGTVRFTARDATVRGAFVQVDLVATTVGEDDATILDLLGQGVFTARDEFDPFAPYGAAGVRMLAGGTAAYGLDYELTTGRHRCLCDRLLNRALPPGSSQTIALWFPAPPAGTAEITLDVPDRLRLTGVRVNP